MTQSVKQGSLAIGLALLCAGAAHLCQRSIDPGRRQAALQHRRDTVPSGPVLQVASSGFHILVADVVWLRTVLAFGEMHQEGALQEPGSGAWLTGSVLAASQLDPQWRTPIQWGGLMLEVANEPEAARTAYQRGVEQFPDEHRFWFALGMLEYFSFEDPQAASEAMAKAAACPGAPEWFTVASLAFGSEQESEEAAIQYLQQQLEATSDPDIQGSIQDRIRRLEHQRLVGQIAQVQEELEAQLGPVPSIAALEAAAGRPLPRDPMGAGWVVDLDGRIRSKLIAEERAEKDRIGGRRLLTNPRIQRVEAQE